jgi:nucleotide-binding universal stress UspA family protein
MITSAIVVATDGTESSKAAVLWAAREAERRKLPLRVAHAFDWEWRAARYDASTEYVELARQFAEAVTAAATDLARTVAPTVKIEADTLIGHAASRLLAVAEDAELMVLGNRGRGGFASLLLGSVSQRVATHAPGSVVIVRGRGDVTAGPIAVGVDDSPAAEHVLATAFEEALSRACALAVIRTYLPPTPLWISDLSAAELEPERDAAEQALLDELLAPWRAKYPTVPIETIVSHDSTAAVLEGVSHTAQLIIVGSCGHGSIASALLGSTEVELLHHADCPVFIARPRSAQPEDRQASS